ncbi:hypothetical protein [Actinoplanes regularis]|uniref:hypothetical protein n=1 Tax=Actinoplanes regularis TaxID=52697 RepID=UPI001177A9E2|nr:hypothetical protein [Actinoplanes regularis]GIE91912.1 hypothetical protein Are01nite_83920 [Actinoplanes regularis]
MCSETARQIQGELTEGSLRQETERLHRRTRFIGIHTEPQRPDTVRRLQLEIHPAIIPAADRERHHRPHEDRGLGRMLDRLQATYVARRDDNVSPGEAAQPRGSLKGQEVS